MPKTKSPPWAGKVDSALVIIAIACGSYLAAYDPTKKKTDKKIGEWEKEGEREEERL